MLFPEVLDWCEGEFFGYLQIVSLFNWNLLINKEHISLYIKFPVIKVYLKII